MGSHGGSDGERAREAVLESAESPMQVHQLFPIWSEQIGTTRQELQALCVGWPEADGIMLFQPGKTPCLFRGRYENWSCKDACHRSCKEQGQA